VDDYVPICTQSSKGAGSDDESIEAELAG
jgi:hypothetical protein